MPYKKDLHHQKQKEYYYNTICCLCNILLTEYPIVRMPCKHKVHMKCLKEDILKNLYEGFWDNWGIHDYYGHCNIPLKHRCQCHDEKQDCYLCIHPKGYSQDVNEINKMNTQCVGKIVSGFYYYGEQSVGNGNIQFICD